MVLVMSTPVLLWGHIHKKEGQAISWIINPVMINCLYFVNEMTCMVKIFMHGQNIALKEGRILIFGWRTRMGTALTWVS